MPQQHRGPSDPGARPGTGLDRLGAVPLRESDPAQVGPYTTLAVLGSGGMGRIYLGCDPGAGHGLAAVKVIRPEYAEDPQFRLRFEREATALARVRGDHTALLLNTGLDGDLVWMATDYIPGLSLSAAAAAHGPMGAAAAWRLAADLGRAVEAMSQVGVVHRDLKPSNVILAADGARVIDFGISQAAETSAITTTGQQLGTPAFMSPEQVRAEPVSAASDVFSLGSTLACAVTGRAPFGDGTGVDVLHRVAFEAPKEDVLAEVAAADPDLASLIASCLEKEPGNRPAPEDVVEAAGSRQVAAPWPPAVGEAIFARVMASQEMDRQSRQAGFVPPRTAAGTGYGQGDTPVRPVTPPTQVRHVPPAVQAMAAPAPAQPPAPFAPAPAVPSVQPFAAAPPVWSAAPAPGPAAVPPAPVAVTAPSGPRRRRTGLLVGAAVVAVAGIAGVTAVLVAPDGHPAAAAAGVTTEPAASADPAGAADAPPTAVPPSHHRPSPSPSSRRSSPTPAVSSPHPGPSTAAATAAPSAAPGATTGHTAPPAPRTSSAAPPPARTTTAAPAPTKAAPPPAWITGCTYYSGTELTQTGDTGARVKEVQCILTKRGYSVGPSGVDGDFGSDTAAAVRRFQTDRGLEVDAQVGPQTWAALRSTT